MKRFFIPGGSEAILCLLFSLLILPLTSASQGCETFFATVNLESAIQCHGGDNGSLSVQTSDGQAPYQYYWSTGEIGESIGGLEAGTYSVNVIDANQCFTVGFYTLGEPDPEEATWTINEPSCELNDGTVQVNALGENDPYLYALNDGDFQSETLFEGVGPGAYSLQLQNSNGCLETIYFSVNAENSLGLESTISDSLSCYGDCQGSIEVTISEPGNFNYTWFSINANGTSVLQDQNTSAATQLCAGNYFTMVESESGGGGTEMFWSEGFGNGCAQGTLADGYLSANGSWTVSQTGTNQPQANLFYISAAEQIGANECGTGCGGDNNQTLHISNVEIGFGSIVIFPADGGALYFADQTTNIRAESPIIDCSGYSDVEISFDYIEFGQGDLDNATVWYFDGITWEELEDLPKTTCCGGACNGFNQGAFTNYNIVLPASANDNPSVKLGFQWTNNNDNQGTDPSFAVDNIELTGTTEGGVQTCPTYSEVLEIDEPEPMELFLVKFANSSCIGEEDGAMQVQAIGGASPYEYAWDIDSITSNISNLAPGEYTVTATDAHGCQISETYEVMEGPSPGTAGFSYSADGLEVTFINNSSGGAYTWDFGDGGGVNSEEENPVYVFPGPGIYQVCLTLTDACGDYVFCEELQFIPTGLEDETVSLMAVFPNPATDILNLQLNAGHVVEVSIIDISGRMVLTKSVTKTTAVDISEWSRGAYTVLVRDSNGNIVERSRVVVH